MVEERKPQLSRKDMLNLGRGLQWGYPVEEQEKLPASMQLQLLRLQAKEGMDKK